MEKISNNNLSFRFLLIKAVSNLPTYKIHKILLLSFFIVTYFHARYLNSTYEEIQTITTTLKEKDKARKEYNKAVQNRDFSAIVTSNSDFRGDEYTIEMGNKPEHTEFIVVQLEYSEPLKPEMRVDERLLSLTVQRHKKKRFKSFDLTNARVNIQAESEPEEPSRWIDEVVIIECLGENANTGGSESMISRSKILILYNIQFYYFFNNYSPESE